MDDDRREPPRPTRGEQIGGVIGCLALLFALLLLAWITWRGFTLPRLGR